MRPARGGYESSGRSVDDLPPPPSEKRMSETKGHDMSRYWRLVNNEGGLVTGTWWVTKPDGRRGTQHVKPIDVTMWSEGRHHGVMLKADDLTAFITAGEVEPISVRARHEHVQHEAEARLGEIAAAVLAVASAAKWDEAATQGLPERGARQDTTEGASK